MDYNSTYEQEIDLKDLMFAVLHQWKPILLVAIVLALLLGGAKGALTYREQNDPEVIKEAEKKYQDDMDTYETNKETYEREIKNLETEITEKEEYLEKSIWINMNPFDICEARVDLYVTTGYEIMPGMAYQNLDYTDTILQAYQAILTSSAVMEKIANTVGTEPRYLKELITVTAGTNSGKLNHLLTINVKNETKDKAEEVLDELLAQIDSMQEQITASIGEHKISTVNHSVSTMVDLTLEDKRQSETDSLRKYRENLETKQKALDELEEPEKEDSSKIAALKSGIKYAVIGGVLGGFVIAFAVCVIFLMSDKVYSAKELKYRYRTKVLGKLSVKGDKKIGGIDRWLNQLEGRVDQVDEKAEFGLIAANIRNYSENMKRILITGSAAPETVARVAKELEGRLEELEVVSGENMLRNAETLGKLPECDGVVLVEQCQVSKYSAVELEIEKIQDLKKTVIGCVIFE